MSNYLRISYSTISSFSRCPYSYYMQYEYRNPATGNKIEIVNPYLSLGLSVHRTIEDLSSLPIKERVKVSLKERFSDIFSEYRGLKGGFISDSKEEHFYKRGVDMIDRVEKSSFLEKPSVNPESKFLSVKLIDGEIEIIGALDWIEELPEGGVHIIDFKTGNAKESSSSLQLPIYVLLASKNLPQKIKRASYWYLQHDDEPVSQEMMDQERYIELLIEKAKEIKKAKEEDNFPCRYHKKCFACSDYGRIFEGDAEMISKGKDGEKDSFCVFKEKDVIEKVLNSNFLDEREKKIFEMRMDNSMEDINLELRLTKEKSDLIVKAIKEKLFKNLRPKELKVVIKTLQ